MAATDKQPLPKNQFPQPEGKSCINIREQGRCDVQGCKAKHEDTGFDQQLCTNPKYLETGLCPGFNHNTLAGKQGNLCLHKHKKPTGADFVAARQKALELYPDDYAHLKNIRKFKKTSAAVHPRGHNHSSIHTDNITTGTRIRRPTVTYEEEYDCFGALCS